jgi:hypothetical protein
MFLNIILLFPYCYKPYMLIFSFSNLLETNRAELLHYISQKPSVMAAMSEWGCDSLPMTNNSPHTSRSYITIPKYPDLYTL